jgi:Flp pilus assembly protein TadD
VRDPAQGVTLARKAVELKPESSESQNMLGVAYYRAGDWAAAIEALKLRVTSPASALGLFAAGGSGPGPRG